MSAVNIASARHYTWGGSCDGWHLLDMADLSMIEERMPPATAEVRHRHLRACQFFRVLDGEAALELEGVVHVPPGATHRMRNASNADVRFLVVSAPHSHGDREPAALEASQ